MGHQRLDKLPSHRFLPGLVGYPVTGAAPAEILVETVSARAEHRRTAVVPRDCPAEARV